MNLALALLLAWAAADRDGDGIDDPRDRCPDMVGVPPDGCAPRDTDGDGLLDRLDACPADPGPHARRGCPAVPPTAPRVTPRPHVGWRRPVLSSDDTSPVLEPVY